MPTRTGIRFLPHLVVVPVRAVLAALVPAVPVVVVVAVVQVPLVEPVLLPVMLLLRLVALRRLPEPKSLCPSRTRFAFTPVGLQAQRVFCFCPAGRVLPCSPRRQAIGKVPKTIATINSCH